MDDGACAGAVLVILEGANDVEFLSRLSRRLHAENPEIPDLAQLEWLERIIFVPTGGGNCRQWATRFATLNCREFHLYDRELFPESENRQSAVGLVNSRSGCCGFRTTKRSLENYLHPEAILRAGGGRISIADDDCVAGNVARHWYELIPQTVAWPELKLRSRKRFEYRAKRWLNRHAVEQMTAELLRERDPTGEVVRWLATIAEMACVSG